MPFQKNQKYKNYLVTKVLPLQEIGCTLIECTHLPTGASIIKLQNDDQENLFSLSFKTWPTKSDGVAHILEHTLLCGSKKYPIKEAFFGMTKRSLNTYMNALTGGDFTCYPASTQVPQDFYNLLSVYLDAVFYPLLQRYSFMQEGHRLEFETKEDPSTPLTNKGIVFNEMKGALGNREARLSEELMHQLYPDITYGVNSGGDPKVITELTHEELIEFHKKYYHPSHCYFFFYGNLPLEEQLDFLEEHAFKGVEKREPLPLLPHQKRFQERKSLIRYYPQVSEDQNEEKVLVSLGYLTCSILEQEELLALNVLDILLMGTDGSPLKMALMKSNLCKQADSYIDNEMNDPPYIIACKGCKEDAAPLIEAVIDKALGDILKEGFPEEMIEGAIHQLEMDRSEITGGSTPYGLSLFFRSALLKQQGVETEEGLAIHTLFSQLRKRDLTYYLSLIKKHFLQNKHRVTIEMRPSLTLSAEEEQEEKERLQKCLHALNKQEIETIVKESIALDEFQKDKEEEEELDCLPKVSIKDVAKIGKEFELEKNSFGNLTLYSHSCFTNQILYVDLIFDLPELTADEMKYFRLFCFLLPQVGSGGRSYKENLDYMIKHTGGITVFFELSHHMDGPDVIHPYLCIRGKSLNRKADKLFALLKDTLSSADFTDKERILELLEQEVNALESSIHRSPLSYGVNLAASNFSLSYAIINQCYGLPYYWELKKILAAFKRDPTPLLAKIASFKEKTLALIKADLVVSADSEMIATLKKEELFGLSSLCNRTLAPWKNHFPLGHYPSQTREINSPVSFTTLLFPTISSKHPDAASLAIGSEIMENLVLHPTIREQGGAYGSGATFSMLSGQFYFYSYRDPHLVSSITAFHHAVDFLSKKQFTEDDVEQAKLEIFQSLDSPIPPYARAFTAYTRLRSGRTPEVRQEYREKLLDCDSTTIQKAATNHLKPKLENACVVSFGGKELLKKESALLKDPLPCYSIEEEKSYV